MVVTLASDSSRSVDSIHLRADCNASNDDCKASESPNTGTWGCLIREDAAVALGSTDAQRGLSLIPMPVSCARRLTACRSDRNDDADTDANTWAAVEEPNATAAAAEDEKDVDADEAADDVEEDEPVNVVSAASRRVSASRSVMWRMAAERVMAGNSRANAGGESAGGADCHTHGHT